MSKLVIVEEESVATSGEKMEVVSTSSPPPLEESTPATLKSLGEDFAHLRFPMKVWRLAGEPSFTPINWSADGKSLLVNELALEPLLATFFRSGKFSSFLRQLHLYGFRKMSKARNFKALPERNGLKQAKQNRRGVRGATSLDGMAEYAAKDFERDRLDLINEVRRFYGKSSREKSLRSGKSGSPSDGSRSPSPSEASFETEMTTSPAQQEHAKLAISPSAPPPPPPPAPSPAPSVSIPILNRPLPSPFTPPSLNPFQYYHFPALPLLYSPTTGRFSTASFAGHNVFASYGYSCGSSSAAAEAEANSQFVYSAAAATANLVDQSSNDSGISNSSFHSSSDSSFDASTDAAFFHLESSQPWPVAYYPIQMVMPSAAAAAATATTANVNTAQN